MRVEEKIRNLAADLGKLADHYDMILYIKKPPKKFAEYLLDQLKDSMNAKMTVEHAMEVHEYCRKNKKAVKALVKRSPNIEHAFFDIARKVFEDIETEEAVRTMTAILMEIKETIQSQRTTILDLTHVERDEFAHLEEWGLRHNAGSKKRIHITEFVHKIEKKIDWKHGNDAHNDKVIERLVVKEEDSAQRAVHLYIISLIKLRHLYDRLEVTFNQQLQDIKKEADAVKKLHSLKYGSPAYEHAINKALAAALKISHDVKEEGDDQKALLQELKEAELRVSEMIAHKNKKKGPFFSLEGHPVQMNHHPNKHPDKIKLDDVFDVYETDTIVFGSDPQYCHVLMHHASPVHARLVRKKGRFYLFNEKGSPGTFVIRKKQPICIVQDKADQKILINRMAMPDKYDYADIIRKKKMEFKVIPPEKLRFPLEEMDLVVIPPGYKFRFSMK